MPDNGLKGDVIVNGEKYVVAREMYQGAPLLRFRRVEDIPLSRHAEGAIPFIWEHGFSSGMGYTRSDPRNPIDSYAFTKGMDAHEPGLLRLAGRRVTLDPTSPSVNKKTWFFEKTPGGDAEIVVGSFTADTGGTTQDVTHGLTVAPKALIFWGASLVTGGTVGTGGTIAFFGMTDGTTERVCTWHSDDNQATSNANRSYRSASMVSNNLTSRDGNVSNIGASTFRVTWPLAPASAYIIHFMAIGGDNIEASVDEWTLPATFANTSVTGVDFTPDVCIHASAGMTTVDTSTTDSDFRLGVMDANGNQWATGIWSEDGVGTSNTKRSASTVNCLQGATGNGSIVSMVSMDADGFTVSNLNTGGDGAMLVATLSLRGLEARAGSTTIAATATTQAAVTLPFASTSFLAASIGTASEDATATGLDHASFSLGAASDSSVEAMSWTDEDAQATTDTYAVSDQALAFEILDHTDGSEDSRATSNGADLNSAGWLNWAAVTTNEEKLYYLALAPISDPDASFVYAANGQRITKMSVSANVITEEDQEDFGSGAECGFGTTFEGTVYLPLGKATNAQKLATAASSGADTWADAGHIAVAYCTTQDGPTARIAKGYSSTASSAAGLVDLSSDGSTYAGAAWEIGDLNLDDEIVRMVDTGTSFYVAKERNLYRADPSRIADKLTHEAESSPDHGVGLKAALGTDAVWYNHGSELFFFDGASRPTSVSIDTNPWNRPIPNITHEPTRGEYLEGDRHGEWSYDLYRVIESGTTKTYLIVSKYLDGRWIQHSYDRFDGWARGCYLDKNFRLWVAYNGDFGYYQFGADGSPDAGRDNIGYGAASTTYYWYASEIDAGLEVTEKRLWQFFILARGIDATCPVQLIVHRDDGSEENVGATITAAGLTKRYWTAGTNDTATKFRLGMKIVTTSGYAPASSDPRILVVGVRVFSEPDVAGQFAFSIDTSEPYRAGDEIPPPAITQRDALYALKYSTVTVIDPDDNSLTLRVVDVSDLRVSEVMGSDGEHKGVHYIVDVVADQRTTPS